MFPYTHDIQKLLDLLSSHGVKIPKSLAKAKDLTPFAGILRYPDLLPHATRRQHRSLVGNAKRILAWAERQTK